MTRWRVACLVVLGAYVTLAVVLMATWPVDETDVGTSVVCDRNGCQVRP